MENIVKKSLLFAVLFTFILFSIPMGSASQEIRIGFSSCLTGPAAYYGAYMKKGVDLAIEEINAKGGIKGGK